MYAELLTLVTMVVQIVDEVPEDEDVKAGWTAFALFGLLILAVIVLGFSLVKRLRNADRAEAEGLYDPSDKKPNPPADSPE
jgi:flagellar biogenesis protein FliO